MKGKIGKSSSTVYILTFVLLNDAWRICLAIQGATKKLGKFSSMSSLILIIGIGYTVTHLVILETPSRPITPSVALRMGKGWGWLPEQKWGRGRTAQRNHCRTSSRPRPKDVVRGRHRKPSREHWLKAILGGKILLKPWCLANGEIRTQRRKSCQTKQTSAGTKEAQGQSWAPRKYCWLGIVL